MLSMNRPSLAAFLGLLLMPGPVAQSSDEELRGNKETAFYEKRIRPILIAHCYECHSEASGEQQGGLLLDRQTGWLEGGDSGKAVLPGEPAESLLLQAVRYEDDALQMPPDEPLKEGDIRALERWVRNGAAGPLQDMGETEFSLLGDQTALRAKATSHWAFQPVTAAIPPEVETLRSLTAPVAIQHAWTTNAIDRFVAKQLIENKLSPSPRATNRELIRRLSYDLTGLPPTSHHLRELSSRPVTHEEFSDLVDDLLDTGEFGQHFAGLWLDVARYADTDSTYRPDTKTPYYFPFAFTYRDYVIESFNADKPFDQFVREQLAADLMGFAADAPELAALGFLAVGPHANRSAAEALDDWIDLTTRGLMGLTVACARCHDHKYEPIPTTDYYALRGVFAGIERIDALSESELPVAPGYEIRPEDLEDYQAKRAEIDQKIKAVDGKKAKNNNRPISLKIRDTELAKLLAFHPGGPAHAMVVREKKRIPAAFVHIRGDATARGPAVERRFLTVLSGEDHPFQSKSSGRLELAQAIVSPDNPLTARVIVNRVWGRLIKSHLVATDSDFGLQGAKPTHPELLDWLVNDFVEHNWSIKHLVRTIVSSQTYQQTSLSNAVGSGLDPDNIFLWKANRKHLTIEELRDSLLEITGDLDHRLRGRPEPFWGPQATRRRAVYGFVNRFNLDPTLRAFDFPAPMQTQPARGESIVAPQALFLLNSPLVIRQAKSAASCGSVQDEARTTERVQALFQLIFQRDAHANEVRRAEEFLAEHQSQVKRGQANAKSEDFGNAWELLAQSLLMSNEFQYVD